MFWPIHRKEAVWTVKPDAGPHPIAGSVPLTLVVRDMLGLAKTSSEAKTVISQANVLVDGRVRKEELYPTGLMDVISIPSIEKSYRVLPSERGLTLHPISKDETGFKLCRIENKTSLDSGSAQLNLHDGRNVLINIKDPSKPNGDTFKTLDTVKISLPTQEIMSHLKLAENMHALIVGGKNIGRHGKIMTIEQREGKRKNAIVTIEESKGERFQTTIEYVFVVGDIKPHISLVEAT